MTSNIVFAIMHEKDIELLKKVCQLRGENVSGFVRRAIKTELARLSFLTEEEKKALGFRVNTVGR